MRRIYPAHQSYYSIHFFELRQVYRHLILDSELFSQLFLLLFLLLTSARLIDFSLPPDRRSFFAHVRCRHVWTIVTVDLELSVFSLFHHIYAFRPAAFTLIL